jgi:WD40 repeat protein
MSIALSPDGTLALSTFLNGPDQPVLLWDVQAGSEVNRFSIPGNPWHANRELHVTSVSFSPDSTSALFGTAFGSIIWWDVSEWRQMSHNVMYQGEVSEVAFSVDGKEAISIGFNSDAALTIASLRVWRLPVARSQEEQGDKPPLEDAGPGDRK